MLPEDTLNALMKVFEERWHGIVTEYLTMMGNHVYEIGELLPSDANRIIELQRMGVNLNRIQNQIAFAAEQSAADIMKIFKAVAESDANFMAKIFGRKTGSMSPALMRAIEAQYNVTFGEMANLSRTTVVSDAYREAVDVAVQSVQGGVSDYNSAIRRTMENAAKEGLMVRDKDGVARARYASGYKMRLDSAVRMNVLDGVRALQQEALFIIGDEFGADGVEISAHALCAEDHIPCQGKQYSKEAYLDLQDSLPRPIGMWNCKHVAHPIILGVTPPTYDEDELEELKALSEMEITIDGKTRTRYQWTQEQRRVETAVRYQKDRATLAKASGDDPVRRDAQYKINKLNDYYDRITGKADLSLHRDRMYVKGFTPTKGAEPL